MAFAYVVERNFETGDDTDWDTKTDTDTSLGAGSGDNAFDALDFPHYTELARYPDSRWAPASGAYCMRVRLGGTTADATLTEADGNIAAAANNFISFEVMFSDDFTGSADDTFVLFQAQDTSNVVQAALGARIVATTNVINFGFGEATPTSFSTVPVKRSTWYTVELDITISSDTDTATNDGTIDMFVTETGKPTKTAIAVGTSQVTMTNTAVTHIVLGLQDQLATTSGTILFDNIKQDDGRLYSRRDRYPRTVLLTKSGHAFVGPGVIDNITLLSGAASDNVLRVFDTDRQDILDINNVVVELKNTASDETVDPAGMPVDVIRGCYVDLAGTAPRALILIGRAAGYGSDASVRNMGRRIKNSSAV